MTPTKAEPPAAGNRTAAVVDGTENNPSVPQFTTSTARRQEAAELASIAILPGTNGQKKSASVPMLARAWNLRTLADAYKPRPPIEYVVAGLFALPSLSILYGAPGSLKSFLLADAAVCVASGTPWLPPLPHGEGKPFRVMQASALWIDLDNGRRRTDDRFAALGRAHNIPEDAPLHYVSMPSPWPNLSEPGMIDELCAMVRHLGAGLVVVDNLGLITGDTNENEAQMSNVMGNLRSLCEETTTAVVVIHHQRKTQGGAAGRKGDSLRGHSSIEAALDLALKIEREDGASNVVIESTKVRGVDVPRFGAIFTYDHKTGTEDLERAMFYRVAVDTTSSDTGIDDAIEGILRELNSANKTALAKAVHERVNELADTRIGINRIRARIDKLASDGKITCETSGRNAQLYRLNK